MDLYKHYLSLGMEKTANLTKYLPLALGAGLLGGSAYGTYKLMNPPTMWDKIKETAGNVGSSLKEVGTDVGSVMAQNPQLLRSMFDVNRLSAMPQMPQMMPPGLPPSVPPMASEVAPQAEQPPMGPSEQALQAYMPNMYDLQQMQDLQNQLSAFSPYR
jgi:hypothetical protein